MKKTASLALLAWILLLPICGAGALKPGTVPSFRLDPVVWAPETAYFWGPESNLKMMGIHAATAEGDMNRGEQLTAFLKAENIDFSRIMLAAIDSRLHAGNLAAKLSETSEYSLKVLIEGYGLGKGHGPKSTMRPSAKVWLVLNDASGKRLWKKRAAIGGAERKLPIRFFDEWLKDPKGLEAAYGEVAKMLAEELLPMPR